MPTPCPVQTAIGIVGGKWKAGILFRLQKGPMRLSQLLREMPWISERVLIRQLKELVQVGVVSRHDHHTIPPRVDYALTPYGQTLGPILLAIGNWGQAHIDAGRAVLPD
ncbi:winged helix-turn-helix transcriptional regulator [Tabrizicola sp.]|uniref:winged helix-turn-helix transcriptional regulator n=1 Tax=Tabrizicola sp. TaxID=2005166 RepID=UPI003F3EF64A